jgi:hypothetical protein
MFGIFKKKPAAGDQPQTKLPGSVEFAREVLAESFEAYKLARRDRPREHNQPHAYSGDAAIMSSHFMMNRRVRDLVRNTAQGKRVRQAFQDLIVGTGFQTFAWPFLPWETMQIVEELDSVKEGVLMPRLKHFLDAYPEIDITLQVSIPLLDVVAEDADLTVRFGTGRYSDVEHICLAKDEVTPLASPAWLRENGPFTSVEDLQSVALLRSPLEPWRTWFAAHDLDWPEPTDGSSFNDIGLMCDAAAQGLGVGLIRTKLGAPWLESGQLVRLFERSVPSPHAHYLCWRTGTMERWECATFAEWLKKALA